MDDDPPIGKAVLAAFLLAVLLVIFIACVASYVALDRTHLPETDMTDQPLSPFVRAAAAQQAVNDLGAGPYGDSTAIRHRSDTNGPCMACQQRDRRVDIRATHSAGFRSGEWALITGTTWMNDRPCYTVRFDDGAMDIWPIHDPSDGYEFRSSRRHG